MNPADKQANTTKETKQIKKKKRFKSASTFQVFNFFLSLGILAALGLAGFTVWQKLEAQDAVIQTQQQTLETILAAQQQVSKTVGKQLTANNLSQANELGILKETIAAFLKRNKHSRRDWLTAEAEYLVKLANHRLILAHDAETGILALQAADNRLREVGNPKFIPLRKAIAINIQQLNATPKVDIVGISVKLNALQQQTAALPLITPDPRTIKQRNSEASSVSTIDNWRQLPSAIWQDLLKLFRIQKHNDVIKPLLIPEQRFFLIQNLKLQLEQARLALLNNQPVLFKNRLKQAQDWVAKYFDNQHMLTKTFNISLTKLAATNITLTLPDISASLTSLQLLQDSNARSTTKKKTPVKTDKKFTSNKNPATKQPTKKAPQKPADSINNIPKNPAANI